MEGGRESERKRKRERVRGRERERERESRHDGKNIFNCMTAARQLLSDCQEHNLIMARV